MKIQSYIKIGKFFSRNNHAGSLYLTPPYSIRFKGPETCVEVIKSITDVTKVFRELKLSLENLGFLSNYALCRYLKHICDEKFGNFLILMHLSLALNLQYFLSTSMAPKRVKK